MEDFNSMDLRSKEFQEVLGEPPGWLLQWGITSIVGIVLVLFTLGYFLKYPETISAPIRLETSNPPLEIAAPALGRLTDILPEETFVASGTLLGRISDNSGDYIAIQSLDMLLTDFTKNKGKLPDLSEFEYKNLGPIQTSVLQFLQIYRNNQRSFSNIKDKTIDNFNNSIKTIRTEIENLREKIREKEAERDKIPKTRKALKKAYANNPNPENNAALRQLLLEENRLKDDIIIYEGQIIQKQREISDRELEKSNLQQDIRGTEMTRRQNLELSLFEIRNEIDQWKISHLIQAPENGLLVYKDKIKSRDYLVDKGDKIFAIVPPGAQDTIEGKLYLSSEESIKVKEGQKVKITFNAYRPSEFGLLNGTVIDKATLPENGQYQVIVQLDKGMISSKEKTITFEHQMRGNAQIITRDRRFTGLIFDALKEMLQRD